MMKMTIDIGGEDVSDNVVLFLASRPSIFQLSIQSEFELSRKRLKIARASAIYIYSKHIVWKLMHKQL